MATEEQKKERLLKVMNVAMYGLIEGLWDLFGESSFATVHSISDKILGMMEKEAGLELAGEDPEDIIMEVSRLLTDEFGTMSSGEPTIDGNKVSIACQDCFLRQATGWLEKDGVQPFACIPMNVTAAAMRQRLGTKHRVLGRDWDEASQTCTINFELV
ncbi:MAG: hypothetical protein KC419_03400 [Anaerolineales bacterium]|nr:hypothetical protein [Anaerolineales bacterium]MCA9927492.1 hypothetical protein [Anaerolineales bacterium]